MSEDLMADIGGLIAQWQPRKAYHIGPNYLGDLKKFLQDQMKPRPGSFFGGKKATLEFVDGRSMDIGVKRKSGQSAESVGIVMMRDLTSLADLRVLMEQVNRAGQEYGGLFVILMGTMISEMEEKFGAFVKNKGPGAKISIVKK